MPTDGENRPNPRSRRAARLAGAVALAAFVLVALPGAARAQAATNSAHEITFWAGFDQVVTLSDAQLDAFADMGVGAFVMSTGYLNSRRVDRRPQRRAQGRGLRLPAPAP